MLGNSLHIGTFAGIPVKIHWTFGLLLLLVVYMGYSEGMSLIGISWYLLTIMALFVCVVLHEYGHALTARKYGVKTRDIILSPIGGVARLERMPEKPMQEFLIAIAGPLVNVAIAVLLLLIFLVFAIPDPIGIENGIGDFQNPVNVLRTLLYINIVLFLFNLVPAFPMDGGRILRSLLSLKFGRLKATKIATFIARGFAILFFAVGLYFGQFILAIIGIFVYFMSGSESKQIGIEASFKSTIISSVMRTHFTRLNIDDPISIPIDKMIREREYIFIVFNELFQEVGVLDAYSIKSMVNATNQHQSVRAFVTPSIRYISPNASVWDAYKVFTSEKISALAVKENGQLTGIVDRLLIQNLIDLKVKS
jgi:Zn-dependent protease